MADERTIPLLPCGSIDEVAEFYGMLGFDVTYRQTRPNPYVVVEREGIGLHFFGLPDFRPEDSYGSCLVYVPDTGVLYQAFAEGMRAAHGKLLVSGIPRMTRPRKRKNTGNRSGFSVVDPGGNWIRIFNQPGDDEPGAGAAPTSALGRALQSAIVLGESKGDHRQAARSLDASLGRHEPSANVGDRVEALVYRAELALVLDDGERADALLAAVRETPLADAEREQLTAALANARELEIARRADAG